MDMSALDTALKMYRLHTGAYPTTEQGLKALVERPEGVNNWRREGGYLEKKITRDGWGNDYVYLCPGEHGSFDIVSYGADGSPGGEGYGRDINSWEIE